MGGRGNVTALKLKDRQRDATASLLFFRFVLLPSSLQPHLVVDGGFFWFGYSLCLGGGGGRYFWYPCGEGVTPAVGLRPSLAHPAAPALLPRGVEPRMGSRNDLLGFFFGGGGQAR